jgi:beta-glucanase (GH16 family)
MKKILYLAVLYTIVSLVSCSGNDDDSSDLPSISLTNVQVTETNVNTMAVIPVTLSASIDKMVSVKITSSDVTANSAIDYKGLNNLVIFEPGETVSNVEVEIVGDGIPESEESFKISISNPFNAVIGNGTAEVIITDDDPPRSVVIPETGYLTPDQYDGMTLIWQDEFGNGSIKSDFWTFEIGTGNNGWGNNELQYYKENNAQIQEGNLIIEARKESYMGAPYTSSRIISMDKFSFKYGRVDIRACLPEGQGIWPALWMLGQNFKTVGWPACGEIDIMEMVGGSEREKTVHGTVHWDDGGHAQYGGQFSLSEGTFNDEFHVFSIIWDEISIRWLVDDQQYHIIDITPEGLSEFQEDFYLILNLAVGGNWPGNPDETTIFPQWMVVDYVRVFQKN